MKELDNGNVMLEIGDVIARHDFARNKTGNMIVEFLGEGKIRDFDDYIWEDISFPLYINGDLYSNENIIIPNQRKKKTNLKLLSYDDVSKLHVLLEELVEMNHNLKSKSVANVKYQKTIVKLYDMAKGLID